MSSLLHIQRTYYKQNISYTHQENEKHNTQIKAKQKLVIEVCIKNQF